MVETENGEQHGSQIFPKLSESVLFASDGRCVDCLDTGHPDFTNSHPACSGASARGSGSSGRILHTDFLVARLLADVLCNKASVTNRELDVETGNFVEVSSTVLSTATP